MQPQVTLVVQAQVTHVVQPQVTHVMQPQVTLVVQAQVTHVVQAQVTHVVQPQFTYVVQPLDLKDGRVCPDAALHVDIVSLAQFSWVDLFAHCQANLRGICQQMTALSPWSVNSQQSTDGQAGPPTSITRLRLMTCGSVNSNSRGETRFMWLLAPLYDQHKARSYDE